MKPEQLENGTWFCNKCGFCGVRRIPDDHELAGLHPNCNYAAYRIPNSPVVTALIELWKSANNVTAAHDAYLLLEDQTAAYHLRDCFNAVDAALRALEETR